MLQLTDEQLDWICKQIPETASSAKVGRPPADKRKMVRGIFWILDNGAKWNDLPAEFGPKSTVHDWFHRWAKAGICERIMRKAGRCVEKRGGFKTALKLAVPRANAVGGAASGSKSSRHSPTAR